MKTSEKYGIYIQTAQGFQCRKPSLFSNLIIYDPDNGKPICKKIKMYTCPTLSKPQRVRKERLSYNWRLCAAMTNHSVFILRRLGNAKGSEIRALIVNLFPKYISYII